MKDAVKLTGSQLRRLVQDELNESGMHMAKAKVEGPLRLFIGHMNGAKQALSELFQQTTDKKAAEQAHALLNAVDRIIKALDNMPELTKDPWHGVRKRS